MRKGIWTTQLLFKKCRLCKKLFSNRRKNGGVFGLTQFLKKRSCSFSCGARSRTPLNKYKIENKVLYIYYKNKIILADSSKKSILLKHRWYVDTAGYAQTTLSKVERRENEGCHVRMHVFLLGKKKGLVIDHINNNKADNRLCNLRFLTHRKNILRSPHFINSKFHVKI